LAQEVDALLAAADRLAKHSGLGQARLKCGVAPTDPRPLAGSQRLPRRGRHGDSSAVNRKFWAVGVRLITRWAPNG